MHRDLLPTLPSPLARALHAFLEEDLPRSADELSDLLSVGLEYVAAVAIADYLDGADAPSVRATDPSLNGWLVSQLASGKAEAGHWARWTKLALAATHAPALPWLAAYDASHDLDQRDGDLAQLLGFRNRVMHGGFVAPVASIRTAIARMSRWFDALAPLWNLRPMSRRDDGDETTWREHRGIHPRPCGAPTIPRPEWDRAGAVLLVDDGGVARLAIDPACVVGPDGSLELQHAWSDAHPALFARQAIAAFFERYQRERRGQVDATPWQDAVAAALPARGRIAEPSREARLLELAKPGVVVRLVGPVGSGRSTLVHALATLASRPVSVLPIEENTVRQDPEVVARWTLQALALGALGEPAPVDALASDGEAKQRGWFERLATALDSRPAPILVIDDADLVGSGLYAGASTTRCLRHARRFGATVVLVHRPAGTPPDAGDAVLETTPLSGDALAAWGDAAELARTTAGHLELLAVPNEGRARLRARIDAAARASALHGSVLDTLRDGPATAAEVAARLEAFTPKAELALRDLLDHLVVGKRNGTNEVVTNTRIGRERSVTVATTERTYALYPAVALALEEVAS